MEVFIPGLTGKEIYIFDNSILALITSLIICIIPVPLERVLINRLDIRLVESLHKYDLELHVTINLMQINYNIANKYRCYIEGYSARHNINQSLLEGIVLLEYINRHNTFHRIGESILCKWFQQTAIRLDLSVGLCQIKISTAALLNRLPPERYIKRLLNPRYSIRMCAKYIKYIIDDIFASEDPPPSDCSYEFILQVAKSYITGSKYMDATPEVEIYATALANYVNAPAYETMH